MAFNYRASARDQASLMLAAYASLALLALALIQLAHLDTTLFIAINHFAAEHASDRVLGALTMFGEGLWDMALIAPFLLVAPRVNAAALYGAPLALVFTHAPKLLLQWPRPALVFTHHQVHLVDAPRGLNSFPSGHAVMAAMVVTVIILGCDFLRRRPWCALPVLGFSVAVSWSRIAVGAHWPRDVLAGTALGVIAGFVGVALAQRFSRLGPRGVTTVAVLYAVGAVVLAFTPTSHLLTDLLRDALVAIGAISAVATITRVRIAEALKRSSRAKAGAADALIT